MGDYKQTRGKSKNDAFGNGLEWDTSICELMFSSKYKQLHIEIFTDMCIYTGYIHTYMCIYTHISPLSADKI